MTELKMQNPITVFKQIYFKLEITDAHDLEEL